MERPTIITPIQKRFSDIDAFNHVNNVAQQSYFDIGKTEYFRLIIEDNALTSQLRIITAATNTSYIGQVRFDYEIQVRTTCEKIGNKSFTLLQQILHGEEILTESRSAMVCFDFEEQISVAIPDQWRSRIEGQ